MNSGDPRSKKILIIDDEASLCVVLMEVMSAHGFRVEQALDWNQAKAKIAAEKPDLIILDFLLPGADGMDMIRQLQVESLRHIPVIAISGRYGDPKFVHTIKQEPNVKDFFKKPIGYVDLAQRIHSLLGTQSPRKPAA